LESSLYATAKPPASSAGLTIRLPEDNLAKLFLNESLACDKLKEAVVADELLFTTIGIFYPSFLGNARSNLAISTV
jgi:hypothetical protein